MEQQNEAARVQRELEQAHSDLRETLEQVNHKVEAVEERLQPQAIMRRNPIALPLLACLVGFLAGSDRHPRPVRWVALGIALGAALTAAHRHPGNGSNRTNE